MYCYIPILDICAIKGSKICAAIKWKYERQSSFLLAITWDTKTVASLSCR